jgi:antitoxin VapB
MRKMDDHLSIQPGSAPSLVALLKTLTPLQEDFPEIPDPPPEHVTAFSLDTATDSEA